MIKFPKEGIILAPSAQHLQIYQEVLKQHSNLTGLQIYPLENYIQSFSLAPAKEDIEILFACKEALKHLSKENTFYESREDADFLSGLLQFMKQAKMFEMSEFPDSTQKEKSLKEIIDLVMGIEISQDHYAHIKNQPIPFDSIYLLDWEYSDTQKFWADFLLENGAHLLKEKSEQTKYYWSAANARKEMEIIAREIIEKGYEAGDVMVALSDPSQNSVLEQIFEAYKIPYSYLKDQSSSKVLPLWVLALKYIMNPNSETACKFISFSNNQAARDIYDYQQVFPSGSNLANMEYEPNMILDEETFIQYKNLESKYLEWLSRYSFMHSWNIHTLEQVGYYIQQLIPSPNEEDIKAFDQVIHILSLVQPLLKDKEDLPLVIDAIEKTGTSRSSKELSGVVIGNRKDISGLRPIVFYVGAHAMAFPGLHLHSGIFDEAYYAKCSYPSMALRIEEQRRKIFEVLSLPEILYVLTPQSDYSGKSLEASTDMNIWMNKYPTFQNVADANVIRKPQFNIDKKMRLELFAPDSSLSTSTNSLMSFKGCPLQHYLKYGLKLKSKRDIARISIPGKFFNTILERAFYLYNKNYTELSYEDIFSLVDQEFDFVKKIFVDKKKTFDCLVREYAFKMYSQLEPLSLFQTKYRLRLANQTYLEKMNWQLGDISAQFKGTLDPTKFQDANFTLYPENIPETLEGDESEAAGSFSLSLNDTSSAQPAYLASYTAATPKLTLNDDSKAMEDYIQTTFKNGWKEQNPEHIESEELKTLIARKPTFEKKRDEWKEIVNQYIEQIPEESIQPFHQPNACKNCAFKSICRNAAKEV